jgi:hypothetical protein
MMTKKNSAESAFPNQPVVGHRKRSLLSRSAIIGTIGLVLAWEVISRSVAAYLADVAPEMALRLNDQQPSALISIADRMLNLSEEADRSGPVASDHVRLRNRQIHTWVESAIMSEPINSRAARILGQLAKAEDNDAYASQFMEAAAHLSVRETYAAYWMMQKKANSHDYDDAIYYADIVLRTRPEFVNYVVPAMVRMTEDRQGRDRLKSLLADNPPWRHRFFATLPNSITDVRTPLDIFLALRKTPTPPEPVDIKPYLAFLVDRNFFELAYYTWLQFLPPDSLRNVGLLFNGSFEAPSSGGPFDWTIAEGAGFTIDIVPRPDESGAHAMLLEFQHGRIDFRAVTQLVMLAPGTYKFDGKYKGKLAGPRGLKWQITCANGGGTQIGDGLVISGAAPEWKNFEFSFTVPTADCRAQYVRLDLEARTVSERLISGVVLFDELEIHRLSNSLD